MSTTNNDQQVKKRMTAIMLNDPDFVPAGMDAPLVPTPDFPGVRPASAANVGADGTGTGADAGAGAGAVPDTPAPFVNADGTPLLFASLNMSPYKPHAAYPHQRDQDQGQSHPERQQLHQQIANTVTDATGDLFLDALALTIDSHVDDDGRGRGSGSGRECASSSGGAKRQAHSQQVSWSQSNPNTPAHHIQHDGRGDGGRRRDANTPTLFPDQLQYQPDLARPSSAHAALHGPQGVVNGGMFIPHSPMQPASSASTVGSPRAKSHSTRPKSSSATSSSRGYRGGRSRGDGGSGGGPETGGGGGDGGFLDTSDSLHALESQEEEAFYRRELAVMAAIRGMRHEQTQLHGKTQVAEMAMDLATQQQREFEKQTAILLDIEQQEEGAIMGESKDANFVDGEGAMIGSPEVLVEQRARLENERSRTEMLQARREQISRDQQRQQQQRAFELETQRHALTVERERTLELEKQIFLRNSLGLEPGEPVPVPTAMPQTHTQHTMHTVHGMSAMHGASPPLMQTPAPAATAMQYTHVDTPFPVVTSGQDMLDMRTKMRILEEQLQVNCLSPILPIFTIPLPHLHN